MYLRLEKSKLPAHFGKKPGTQNIFAGLSVDRKCLKSPLTSGRNTGRLKDAPRSDQRAAAQSIPHCQLPRKTIDKP